MAPEKFAGAVQDVPFVGPLTTMLHPELPLTISDRSEWGDPLADSAPYECITSYSPNENIRQVRYPPVLAICGVNDQRVGAIESLKWIHRLRNEALGPPSSWTSRKETMSGPGLSTRTYARWLPRAPGSRITWQAIKQRAEWILHNQQRNLTSQTSGR